MKFSLPLFYDLDNASFYNPLSYKEGVIWEATVTKSCNFLVKSGKQGRRINCGVQMLKINTE